MVIQLRHSTLSLVITTSLTLTLDHALARRARAIGRREEQLQVRDPLRDFACRTAPGKATVRQAGCVIRRRRRANAVTVTDRVEALVVEEGVVCADVEEQLRAASVGAGIGVHQGSVGVGRLHGLVLRGNMSQRRVWRTANKGWMAGTRPCVPPG